MGAGGKPLAEGFAKSRRRCNADSAIPANPLGFARSSMGPDMKRFSILNKPNGSCDAPSVFVKGFDVQIFLFFKLFECHESLLNLFIVQ
jgi:hypothetical protein